MWRTEHAGLDRISIHALLAESDQVTVEKSSAVLTFLSTLSLRRATAMFAAQIWALSYFYPRSPCGERRHRAAPTRPGWAFLSTLSLRRATRARAAEGRRPEISIHALLAESDGACRGAPQSRRHFYPRSPCGERRSFPAPTSTVQNFYPRSPCGERPRSIRARSRWWYFYPRSPCGERLTAPGSNFDTLKFLSTLSLRRATTGGGEGGHRGSISIHALLAESDYFYFRPGNGQNISIHALLAESDFLRISFSTSFIIFLSTLSLRRATY